ncbi:MAG: hypothetical protein HND47_21170 [Chloroflexi bacterium]|nr:hypothetical protein [Chloroflexota bacterium]
MALNNLFGETPSERIEDTYEFATMSRQDQLDMFVDQYFEDIGVNVVYKDLGVGRNGLFIEAGSTYLGEYYDQDTLLIGEASFKAGWEEVGITILHEILEQYRDSHFGGNDYEIRELENLWREWYRQDKYLAQ